MKVRKTLAMKWQYQEALDFMNNLEDVLFTIEKEADKNATVILTISELCEEKSGDTYTSVEIGVLTSIDPETFYNRGSGR